ncbi:MAG: hypothetical protein RLY43_1285 [Bacteroidota bacterium]|jgi:hypothetical protein
MNEPISYVVLQQRGNKLLEFEKTDYLSYVKSEMQLEIITGNKMTYQGEISKHGKARMSKALLVWSQAINFWNEREIKNKSFQQKQINFITLTLCAPQRHSDRIIKSKILAPFMRILKRDYAVENYIWKAESQENLNIHFHLLVDVYIDKVELRNIWNSCLDSLGYLDRFEEKFHHRDPHSTMIEAVSDFGSIERYMAKYIGKSDNYRLIEGAVWKCSKKLSKLQFFECERSTFEERKLQSAVVEKKIEFKSLDFCNVYNVKACDIFLYLSGCASSLYRIYRDSLLDYVFDPSVTGCFSDLYFEKRNLHKPARCAVKFEIDIRESLHSIKQKKKITENVSQLSFGFCVESELSS